MTTRARDEWTILAHSGAIVSLSLSRSLSSLAKVVAASFRRIGCFDIGYLPTKRSRSRFFARLLTPRRALNRKLLLPVCPAAIGIARSERELQTPFPARARTGERERERGREIRVDYGYCAVRAQRREKRRRLTSRSGFLTAKTPSPGKEGEGEDFPTRIISSIISGGGSAKRGSPSRARTWIFRVQRKASNATIDRFRDGRTRALIAKTRQFVTADLFNGDGTRVSLRQRANSTRNSSCGPSRSMLARFAGQ